MDKKLLPVFAHAIKAAVISATLLPAAAHANVVWDFVETDLTCMHGPCTLPTTRPLAELILPGPNGSGSASWLGGDPIPPPNNPPPVWNGDPFIFAVGSVQFGSANLTGSGAPMRSYEISWNEVDNVLTSIFVSIDASRFTIQMSGNIAKFGTDGFLGGCENDQCQAIVFWVDPPGNTPQLIATPEPGSLSLLFAALGLFGIKRRVRHD